MTKTLTSLQYSPQALQLSSSLSPLLQSGVCVAPQFEHSALTPPGAEWLVGTCVAGLVAVAPGPEDRVVAPWVRTLSDGRELLLLLPVPLLLLLLPLLVGVGALLVLVLCVPSFEGATVWGRASCWCDC